MNDLFHNYTSLRIDTVDRNFFILFSRNSSKVRIQPTIIVQKNFNMASNVSGNSLFLYERLDMIFVYALLMVSVLVSLVVATFIIVIIFSTQLLHSPANLLVFNTSMATIFLVIVSAFNGSYFFFELPLTDYQCRILAYLTYVFLTASAYSYVIQGISRLFFTVFPQHRGMLGYKSHSVLMLIQIIGSFLIPLPSLVTSDIVYRRLSLCVIPMKYLLHVAYFFASSYFIPLFIVLIIYLIIHRRVKSSSRNLQNTARLNKRDLQLTRNIVILLTMVIMAGCPGFIFLVAAKITSSPLTPLYMFTFSSTSLATAIEKVSVTFLNKDLRNEVRKRFRSYLPCFCMNRIEVEILTLPGISTTGTARSIATTTRR